MTEASTLRLPGSFYWLRAETHIHVGVGQVASLIDLPFARETSTDYPFIPGSGLKGSLRSTGRLARPSTEQKQRRVAAGNNPLSEGDDSDEVIDLFGVQDQGGKLMVSDGRLAFLPLRSLDVGFVMATCPHILNRIARDRAFAGISIDESTILAAIDPLAALLRQGDRYASLASLEQRTVIEDFSFLRQELPQLNGMEPEEAIDSLFEDLPDYQEHIRPRLVILRDADFAYFCRTSLHVRTRNRLNQETKTVERGALWSEESLPPDTVLYAVVVPRDWPYVDRRDSLRAILSDVGDYLQVGGNETVGEGWLKLFLSDKTEATEDFHKRRGDLAVHGGQEHAS